MRDTPRLKFKPATADHWDDLEKLFGPRGACAGCWCMYYRQSAAEFRTRKGALNKHLLRRLVGAARAPGIIAYAGNEPVGWCAIAPRTEYPRLERARNLKPVDDTPVWSVPCLFVAREWRGRGITVGLIEAAVKYARQHGAPAVEGYPIVPESVSMPSVFAWNGFISAFRKAGFTEVARRSKRQAIVRRILRRSSVG